MDGCGPPGRVDAYNDITLTYRRTRKFTFFILEFRQQQNCTEYTLRSNTMIQAVNSAFSPSHLFNTVVVPRTDVIPPSFVHYTNRPFGHQRRDTKREHRWLGWVRSSIVVLGRFKWAILTSEHILKIVALSAFCVSYTVQKFGKLLF